MIHNKVRVNQLALVFVIAMLALSFVPIVDRASATAANDVRIAPTTMGSTFDGVVHYSVFYASGTTSIVSLGSTATYFQVSSVDSGAVNASDALARSYLTLDVTSGGTSVASFNTTAATYTPVYNEVFGGWTYYVNFNVTYTVNTNLVLTTKLYTIDGGVASVKTTWINHINVGSASLYDDMLTDATYYHGSTYDNYVDGTSVVFNGSASDGYLDIRGMHGNGTAPLVYKNPVESYVTVTLVSPNGTTILQKRAYEYGSSQTPNPLYYDVVYDKVELISTYFTTLGIYNLYIDLYTQTNAWTSFVHQDRWGITITNLQAYTAPDTSKGGSNGQDLGSGVVQGFGITGIMMMVLGPMVAIWLWKHDSPVGALAALILMPLCGFAIARAFMGF